MSYDGPGIYRHYKGGEYEVLGLGFGERHKEVGFELTDPAQQQVVYRPLTPGSLLDDTEVAFWLRPLRDFDADVEIPQGTSTPTYSGDDYVPRFDKISELR